MSWTFWFGVIVGSGLTAILFTWLAVKGYLSETCPSPEISESEAASKVVSQIVKDLSDRRGLRQEWEQIDPGTTDEIIQRWEEIVRLALAHRKEKG